MLKLVELKNERNQMTKKIIPRLANPIQINTLTREHTRHQRMPNSTWNDFSFRKGTRMEEGEDERDEKEKFKISMHIDEQSKNLLLVDGGNSEGPLKLQPLHDARSALRCIRAKSVSWKCWKNLHTHDGACRKITINFDQFHSSVRQRCES